MRLKRGSTGPAGPALRGPSGGKYSEAYRRRTGFAPSTNTFTNTFDDSLGRMRRFEGYRVLLILMLAFGILAALMMHSFSQNYDSYREGANERMTLGYHRHFRVADLDFAAVHERESERFRMPVACRLVQEGQATMLEVSDVKGHVLRTRHLDAQDLNVDQIRREYQNRTGDQPDQVTLFYRHGKPMVLVQGISDNPDQP